MIDAMNDATRHGIMTAFLRRKRCDGDDTYLVAAACSGAEAKLLNIPLEDGELAVAVTMHASGRTLLVTTRRLCYVVDGPATSLPLASIRGIRPHLFTHPGRMYLMEVESDKRPVLVVRTEPGLVFHALLGLLIKFADRQPQGGAGEEASSGIQHLFDG